MKTVPLYFRQMIGKDLADFGPDQTIKHITWMGVVCVMDDYGRVIHYWHGPS